MSTLTNTRTIVQARAELLAWGRFWRGYVGSTGGGSLMAEFMQNQKSATKYHKRITVDKENIRAQKCRGLDIPYSADCSPTHSSPANKGIEIFVPWELRDIDDLIESMQQDCRNALRRKYIKRDGNKGFWVNKAEIIVMRGL